MTNINDWLRSNPVGAQPDDDEEDRQTLESTALTAPDLNPDDAAAQRRVANEAGVSPVLGGSPLTARAVDVRRLRDLQTTNPRLAAWMAQPDNYAVARDDADNLSIFERLGRDVVSGEIYRRFGPVGDTLAAVTLPINPLGAGSYIARRQADGADDPYGAEQTRQGEMDVEFGRLAYRSQQEARGLDRLSGADRLRLTELASREGQDDWGGFVIGPTRRLIPQIVSSFERAATEAPRRFSENWENPFPGMRLVPAPGMHNPSYQLQIDPSERSTARRFLEGSIATTAQLPGALVAGFGGLVGGYLSSGYEMETGTAFHAMVQQGIDPTIAAERAEQYGAWATAIEFASDTLGLRISGVGRLATRAFFAERILAQRPAVRVTQAVIGTGFEQGFEEASQEASQIIHADLARQDQERGHRLSGDGLNATVAESFSPERREAIGLAWSQIFTPEHIQQVLQAGYIGFQGGVGLGLVPGGANFALDVRAARQAEAGAQRFEQYTQAAQASRLNERGLPDALESAVSAINDSNVYIDADRFVEHFQSAGVNAYAVADELGISEGTLATALASHGQVEIPTSTFAARVLRIPQHASLAEHARIAPDADTPAEVRNAGERIQAEIERMVEETKGLQTDNEIGQAVETRMRELFTVAQQEGGPRPEVAARYARLVAALPRAVLARARQANPEYAARLEAQLRRLFGEGLDIAGPGRNLQADGAEVKQRGVGIDAGPVRSERWDPPEGVRMSDRMREIVEMAVNGASNDWIAAGMDVEPNNIRVTLSQAKAKLGGQTPWERGGQGTPAEPEVSTERLVGLYDKLARAGYTNSTDPNGDTINTIIARTTGMKLATVRSRLSKHRAAMMAAERAAIAEPETQTAAALRREWVNTQVVRHTIPGGEAGDFHYGFVLSSGRQMYVGIADDGNGAAVIDWSFLDRLKNTHEENPTALYGDGTEKIGASEWRELRIAIRAIFEADMADHERPAYMFTPQRESNRRSNMTMIAEMGEGLGYDLLEDQGSVYLLRTDASIGANGRIKPQPGWDPQFEEPQEYGSQEEADDAQNAFYASVGEAEVSANGPTLSDIARATRQERREAEESRAATAEDAGGPARGAGSGEVNQGEKGATRAYQQGEFPDGVKPYGMEAFRPGEFGEALIRLTESADLSTFLHESGHLFHNILEAIGTDQNAPEELRQLWQTTLDWWGVDAETWAGIPREARVPYYERWAETFERYLLEGQAPSLSLREVFATFKQWLLDVYRSVVRFAAQNPNANLTPEIRGVFDRLLATEAEIAEARAAMGSDFALSREAFKSDEEFAQYQSAIAEAKDAQEAELRARAMSAYARKSKRWWRGERERMRDAATRAVDSEPARRVEQWLGYQDWKTLPSTELSDEGEIGYVASSSAMEEMPEGLPPMQLSGEAVAQEWPEAALPVAVQPRTDVESVLAEAMRLKAQEKGRGSFRSQRLASFIRKNGGVQDADGRIREGMGSARRRPGVVNANGLTPEHMMGRAAAAGYFGEAAARLYLNEAQAAQITNDIVEARKAAANRPSSLTTWVRSQGGMRDDRGDVEGSAGDAQRGFARLLHADGRSIDDLALAAWEAGFFPDHAERPSVAEFIDALDEESRGRMRSADIEAQAAANAATQTLRAYGSMGIDTALGVDELRSALHGAPNPRAISTGATELKQERPDAGGGRIEQFTRGMQQLRDEGFDIDQPLYHATGRDFPEFDLDAAGSGMSIGTDERAIFLTDSPIVADSYLGGGYVRSENARGASADMGGGVARWYSDGSNVRPVYARPTNMDDWDFGGGGYTPADIRRAIKEAREAGRNGVIIRNVRDAGIMTSQGPLGGNPNRPANLVVMFRAEDVTPRFPRAGEAGYDANAPGLVTDRAAASQSGDAATLGSSRTSPDGRSAQGGRAPRRFEGYEAQYAFANEVADAIEQSGGNFGPGLQLVLKTRTAGVDRSTPVFNIMRDGERIGIVDLNADETGLRLHPTLDAAHRRQNIGTQLYRYLERVSGQPLSRSDNLTEGGAGLWRRLDRERSAPGVQSDGGSAQAVTVPTPNAEARAVMERAGIDTSPTGPVARVGGAMREMADIYPELPKPQQQMVDQVFDELEGLFTDLQSYANRRGSIEGQAREVVPPALPAAVDSFEQRATAMLADMSRDLRVRQRLERARPNAGDTQSGFEMFQGRAPIIYHGSAKPLNGIRPVLFATPDHETAAFFARLDRKETRGMRRVTPLQPNFENPMEVQANGSLINAMGTDRELWRLVEQAQANGNDAIIVHNVIDGPAMDMRSVYAQPIDVYIILDPLKVEKLPADYVDASPMLRGLLSLFGSFQLFQTPTEAVAEVLARVDNAASDVPRNDIPREQVRAAYPKVDASTRVSAREAAEDGEIVTSWATLQYRAGRDMIVGEAQGDARPVRKDIFDLTFEEVAPGEYAKRSDIPVGYFVVNDTRTIETLEGPVEAKPGDYVLIGGIGEMWPIKPAKFAERYDVAQAPVASDKAPTVEEFLTALAADLNNERQVYSVRDGGALASAQSLADAQAWFDAHDIDITKGKDEIRDQIVAAIEKDGASENQWHPDDIAPWFGYSSGDELIQALSKLKPRAVAIEEHIDRLVEEEHGDAGSKEKIAASARAAAHAEVQARRIEVELAALEKVTGGRRKPVGEAARAYAEDQVQQMTLREIKNADVFLAGERRAARAAFEAASKKDWPEAARQKQKQLLSFWLFKYATEAAENVTKIESRWKRYSTSSTTRAAIGTRHIEQIDAILDTIETGKPNRRPTQTLQEWAQDLAAEDAADLIIFTPEAVEQQIKRPLTQMSYAEVQSLNDVLRNIETIGRGMIKLRNAREAQRISDIQAELRARIQEEWKEKLSRRLSLVAPNAGEKGARELRHIHAQLLKIDYLARLLDGLKDGGPWMRMMAQAQDAENDLHARSQAASQQFLEIVRGLYTPQQFREMLSKRIYIDEIEDNRTKAQIISAALNVGNQYNREALVRGEKWSEAQLQAVLSKMSDTDWSLVQALWNYVGQWKEESFALDERTRGSRPPEVMATPVTLPSGRTLSGGYWPVSFDSDRSDQAAAREAQSTIIGEYGGAFRQAATNRGRLKARAGTGGQALSSDFMGVLAKHVHDSLRDITHRELVITMRRVKADKELRNMIARVAGRDAVRALDEWVHRLAARTPANVFGDYGRIAAYLRRAATSHAMGFKVSVATLNLLGHLQAIPRNGIVAQMKQAGLSIAVGFPDLLRRHLQAFGQGQPEVSARVALVYDKSETMRHRRNTFDRDINEVKGDLVGRREGAVLPKQFEDTLQILNAYTDQVVSVPTWLAAYESARDGKVNGVAGDEASVAYADSVVRMTLSAGGTKDMAALIASNNQWQRLMTMFMGWASAFYNQMFTEQVPGVMSGKISLPRFTANMIWIWMLPAVITTIFYGQHERRDDEDEFAYLMRMIGTGIIYPLQTIPLIRDLLSALVQGYRPQTPVGAVIDRSQKLASAIERGDERQMIKQGFLLGGQLSGVPAQFYTTGDYAADLAMGNENPADDPADALQEAFLRDTR